jgi:hypothetical protein
VDGAGGRRWPSAAYEDEWRDRRNDDDRDGRQLSWLVRDSQGARGATTTMVRVMRVTMIRVIIGIAEMGDTGSCSLVGKHYKGTFIGITTIRTHTTVIICHGLKRHTRIGMLVLVA